MPRPVPPVKENSFIFSDTPWYEETNVCSLNISHLKNKGNILNVSKFYFNFPKFLHPINVSKFTHLFYPSQTRSTLTHAKTFWKSNGVDPCEKVHFSLGEGGEILWVCVLFAFVFVFLVQFFEFIQRRKSKRKIDRIW